MESDLDTLLTALYVVLDDHILPSLRIATRPGRPAEVADAEVICLAVAQVCLGFPQDARWLRNAHRLVGHLFPRLLSQPEYGRRVRALAPAMHRALVWLARDCPLSEDVVRLLDGTKIVCGMSRVTVKRSNLFGYCGYGYDASHSQYFWGCKLMLDVTAHGLVCGFCLVNPQLHGEREAVLMMQDEPSCAMVPGTTAVGDKGFRGRVFEAALLRDGVVLIRPAGVHEADPGVFPKWLRERVEAIIGTLKGKLGIEHPGARVPVGLFARVVQRLLALNAAIWWNWIIGADPVRSLTAYDHVAVA